MNLENVVTLLEQLILKTESHKLTWERTSKSKSFKASLKTATVIVTGSDKKAITPGGEIPVYSFAVYDENNDKLFERSAGGIFGIFATSGLDSAIEEKIIQLFNAIEDINGKKIKFIIDELLGL